LAEVEKWLVFLKLCRDEAYTHSIAMDQLSNKEASQEIERAVCMVCLLVANEAL
jgi:hypothetical protein